MRCYTKVGAAIAVCLLVVLPAMATADPGNGNSNGHGIEYAPGQPPQGPGVTPPDQAKAYGQLCQAESKKHLAGEKGTPFSQCVTALAKAAHNERITARQACKGLSKKHVKGEKGTPFSRCISGVAKLRG
jgi:hypothetical protein